MDFDQKGLKRRSMTVEYFVENINKSLDIKLRRLNNV
ncbi:MAG: HPr kinase/phosphorylase, partial [Chlorobiales bacterium]|nr:HPr kinase/phosphorylase [Chlorobiales bacterium]